jgi:hypothetical protein
VTRWKTEIAIVLAGLIVGACVLLASRWQISVAASQGGNDGVYRLDRWTGTIEYCQAMGQNDDGSVRVVCPATLSKGGP